MKDNINNIIITYINESFINVRYVIKEINDFLGIYDIEVSTAISIVIHENPIQRSRYKLEELVVEK